MKKRWMMAWGVFAVLSLTGCEAADSNLNETFSGMEKLDSLEGDIAAALNMEMTAEGVSLNIDMGLEGTWEMVQEPKAFHFDGNIRAALFGLESDVELYCVQDGEELKLYAKVYDEWAYERGELQETVEALSEEDSRLFSDMFAVLESSMTVDESEDMYEYQIVFGAEDLVEILNLVDKFTMEELNSIVGMDVSDFEGKILLAIEKDTMYIKFAELDFTESLNMLMQDTVEELGVEEASVTDGKITINMLAYDQKEAIVVPEEAVKAEVE